MIPFAYYSENAQNSGLLNCWIVSSLLHWKWHVLLILGRLISRSNVFNNLYFVSLRVQRVLKGSVPKRMHRHMRLLFHTSHMLHHHQRRHQHQCLPVSFNVKTGRKYVVYVKKVATGRYVAIAQPDVYTKKVRKAAKKLLCQNCGKFRVKNDINLNMNDFNFQEFKLNGFKKEVCCTIS